MNISEIVPANVRIQPRTNTWDDNDLILSINDWFLRFFSLFFFYFIENKNRQNQYFKQREGKCDRTLLYLSKKKKCVQYMCR